MKEENRMMQDEMMNEEEIIGKEIEKELENTPEKNTEKSAQKEKMINLMNRYHFLQVQIKLRSYRNF